MSQANVRHFLFIIRVSPVHLFIIMSGIYPSTLKVSKDMHASFIAFIIFNMLATKSHPV